MNSLNQQVLTLVAHGILPSATPLLGFAPQAFGCRAKAVSPPPVQTWEITLNNPLTVGTFYFFWGPTIVTIGTSDSMTVIISAGQSTDKIKTLVLGAVGDICFQFFQIPTIGA